MNLLLARIVERTMAPSPSPCSDWQNQIPHL